jgi:hypothetical protein
MELRTTMLAAVLVVLTATEARPQASFGVALGGGSGSVGGAVLSVNGRARLVGDLHVTAAHTWLAGPWGCAAIWPESYRCGFDGNVLHLGPSLQLLTSGRASAGVGALFGLLSDFGAWPGEASTFLWGLDATGRLAITRRVHSELALQHWQMRDELFESLFQERVYLTALSLGVRVAVWK